MAKAKAKKHVGQNLKAEMEDEVYNEYDDGEFEEDDEGNWEEYGAPTYSSPAPAYPSAVKRTRQAPARQISSEDSADLTYRGPPAKRTKKSSKYQLNERNEWWIRANLRKSAAERNPFLDVLYRIVDRPHYSNHTFGTISTTLPRKWTTIASLPA